MDYYIRSWDPDSTYPANPQEGDVCYTITLDQSWAPVAGVKNDNLLKTEIYTSGNWVEQGGGESMKRVKVALTMDGYGDIDAKDADGVYGGMFETEGGLAMSLIAESAGTVTGDLLLFGEGPALFTVTGNYVSSSGGCEWDAVEEVLKISGDCAVTVESDD